MSNQLSLNVFIYILRKTLSASLLHRGLGHLPRPPAVTPSMAVLSRHIRVFPVVEGSEVVANLVRVGEVIDAARINQGVSEVCVVVEYIAER